jgi:hypothetical protein
MSSIWSIPLRLSIPPLLALFAVPLFLAALLTSFFALTALAIRTSYVYAKLSLRLLSSYILALVRASTKSRLRRQQQLQKGKLAPLTIAPSPISWTPTRRMSRSGTASSSPVSTTGHRKAASIASFESRTGDSAPREDYEGLGGWRDSIDEEEEAAWLALNARLELPASSTMYAVQQAQQASGSSSPTRTRKHHRRSWTGGSLGVAGMTRQLSWYGSGNMKAATPLVMGMSGVNIKAGDDNGKRRSRTPSNGSTDDLGYFGQSHHYAPGRKRSNASSLTKKDKQ